MKLHEMFEGMKGPNKIKENSERLAKLKARTRMSEADIDEAVSATDYNPSSQGGTRKELLAKLAKSKNAKDAEYARKAGATQDELKKALDEDESLQIGDKVHLGFGTKGGAGFDGTIIKIEGNTVYIKHENGNTYKGPIKNVSKMDSVDEGWGAEGQKRDMQDMLAAKEAMLKKYADNPKMVAMLKDYMSKGWNAAAAEKESLSKLKEGYKVLPPIDDRYQERDGLEGPFRADSGKVLYYDPREGRYYDPDTDMYLSHEEYEMHMGMISGMQKEARGIEGMARKFVPGYGKAKARKRADDYGFSGHLDKEYAKYHGDEDAARDSRIAFKAQKKYKKIASEDESSRKLAALSRQEADLIKKYRATKSDIKRHYLDKQINDIARQKHELQNSVGESMADMDMSVKSYGQKGDGIDPTDKVIVQHISGGKKYYYKRGSKALERVLQNIRKGAPYHVVSDDYKNITDEDMAQALKFAQADSEKARNPKVKKFGSGAPVKKKDSKKSEMPDVYFAMEELTEAPNTEPNQLQKEAASGMGFEFDGVVFVRTRKATQDNSVTEVALHAVNPESGEHAMVFDDGGIVRGSSIDDLTGEGWIAQGENLGESWPTQYVEKKVNLKNLARMIDSGKDPNKIKGLAIAAESLDMSVQELIDLACSKYLEASDYNDYVSQSNLREYLERINESIASFQIDDPLTSPKDLEWTGSPEWAGKAQSHGISRGGTSARAELGPTKSSSDLQSAWRSLLPKLKRVSHSPAMQKKVIDTLTKLSDIAKKHGVELTPNPGDVLPNLSTHKTLGLGH